jgi:DNA polymerase-3 subunit epsilon
MSQPIAFFDLETTGVDKQNDRIVEIAIIRFDGEKRYEYTTLVNPGMPIPVGASDVHGITDEAVKDCPTFAGIARKVHNILNGCVLAGFNSNIFDIPFIVNELSRNGYHLALQDVPFIDVCNIFKRREERTLSAAVKFYLNKEHEGAHGALADVQATIDVFEAQKVAYDDLPADVTELSKYCNYDKDRADIAGCFSIENGEYMMNFGKHKGSKAADCISYLSWMANQDFAVDTKSIINKILNK